MLFSTFVFISTLFAVAQAVALEERAACRSADKTNKYVQHSHGSASFTVYSGCGAGGNAITTALCLSEDNPVTEFILFYF